MHFGQAAAHGDLPPRTIRRLIARRIGEHIPVPHVVGQCRANDVQLVIAGREKRTAARFGGNSAQEFLASKRHAGYATDTDDVHRGVGGLRRGQRIIDRARAALVVAVGDEHDDAATFYPREGVSDLYERVEDCRSARRTDRRNRFAEGLAIVSRSGDGVHACRKGRHDHAIQRRHVVGECRRRALHEVDPAGHAAAAVDQQRERRAHRLLLRQVDLLRHAIFHHAEVSRRNALDGTALLVLHGGFEEDARHLRFLDHLERLAAPRDRRARGRGHP